VDDLGADKRIYVWFDAVIGYLSAAVEWASTTDDPDAWKAWWLNPEAESYYFVGKDNIPFHAVIWPAMLLGHGDLDLPTDVPANQYITFKGAKASKSKGVGRSIGWYADRLEPDAIRYAIASVFPEQNDTDLSDDLIISRINEELVATWGNLVNRVLSMTARYFDGQVPEPADLTESDEKLLSAVDTDLAEVAAHIERVELRAGLRTGMDTATEVNAYLNAEEPWKTIKTDPARAATVLWVAIQAIAGIRVALSPYLPNSTQDLGTMLGVDAILDGWKRVEVPGGQALGPIAPLFTKLDDDVLD
ncbi:MAG: methionine--tRNA ligase, partial [Acidimicrobiia bacterium]